MVQNSSHGLPATVVPTLNLDKMLKVGNPGLASLILIGQVKNFQQG